MTSVGGVDDDSYHMAHIPEEDESSEEGSINMTPRHSMYRDHDDDDDDDFEEEEEEEEFDEPTPLDYHWSHHMMGMSPEDAGSEATSYSGDFQMSGLSIDERTQNIIFEGIKDYEEEEEEEEDDDEEEDEDEDEDDDDISILNSNTTHTNINTGTKSSRRGSFHNAAAAAVVAASSAAAAASSNNNAPPPPPPTRSRSVKNRFSFGSSSSAPNRNSARGPTKSNSKAKMGGVGASPSSPSPATTKSFNSASPYSSTAAALMTSSHYSLSNINSTPNNVSTSKINTESNRIANNNINNNNSNTNMMHGRGGAKRRVTISVPSPSSQQQQQHLLQKQRHTRHHYSHRNSGEAFEDEPNMSASAPPKMMARQFSRRRPSVSLRMGGGGAAGVAVGKPGIVNAANTGAPETVMEDEGSSTSPSTSRGGRLSRKSIRRASFNTVSVTVGSGTVPGVGTSGGSGTGSGSGNNTSNLKTGSGAAGVFDSVDSAISSLGQGDSSDWENVAAAAAVVAAGTGVAGKRSHIQFAVDEKVLVYLNILNHTNLDDNRDDFTVNPVNKYGFPPGEGKHSYEQAGPYVYVLATVKKVHFDEDVRYYTVAREDTGAQQRADTEWMEPIKSATAIEAAARAAFQTSRSEAQKEIHPKDETNTFSEFFLKALSWPVICCRNKVIPFYRRTRATSKKHIALMLYGDSPYACKLRVTGINLLALCSFVYLFLEVVSLAFFPARTDFAVAVVGVIVWSILALELIMEWLIRPLDYIEMIASDRAYAPSTARNINAYHLIFEAISLALFIPEIVCLHSKTCGERMPLSGLSASLAAVIGRTRWASVFGRFWIGLRTFRIFGLVRHWKKMWINNTFRDENKKNGILRAFFLLDFNEDSNPARPIPFRKRKNKVDDETTAEEAMALEKSNRSTEEDQRLKKAATIGTALMVVNSHRALFILVVIVTIFPMIHCIRGVNRVAEEMTDLLHENNLMYNTSCDYLENAFQSWTYAVANAQSESPTESERTYVLWAHVEPPRCDFLKESNGVITFCKDEQLGVRAACDVWNNAPEDPKDANAGYFAEILGVRKGGIVEISREVIQVVDNDNLFLGIGQTESTPLKFKVRVLYNQNHTVSFVNFSSVLLLFSTLVLSLTGLTVLRGDAGRLVLHPLQRMLKIIVLYAENPLGQTAVRKSRKRKGKDKEEREDGNISDGDRDGDKQELGNYETEQLINAISKIADLLRKCWGVAGAGIISSNLARTQDGKTVVFNPTVPGKRVYALFGFVAINGFSAQLRALDRDVMILINDVAKVVHDEVYRWSLGDSGQCNKNLGAAFLMVFRIGDFTEVHEKQARATDVVFSSHDGKSKRSTIRRRNNRRGHINHGRSRMRRHQGGRGQDTLQLASLPGIQSFSDRALLGMLKSFAGIHRDRNLQDWKKDFRLGAGVGAFTVNIIIGMDAGWAVEGAVGSEYKIDATYLSPHVNMASRMMSASKQYGVTILLSQAVEELLSHPARSKLRHLDTVYVKGSSVAQRIFTYDARHKGVDFFLFERSPEQADVDADSYSPAIWENDQDLRAMRQHVTEDFKKKFDEGKAKYLVGDWEDAIETLKKADDIMITTVLEEGYLDYNPDDPVDERIFDRNNQSEEIVRIRNDLGDGACKCLIAYMKRAGGKPPPGWKGVRPLTSK